MSDPRLAAAMAAIAAVLDEEARAAAAPDPVPAAYRSRWRRAALIEGREVPARLKDDDAPWGVH